MAGMHVCVYATFIFIITIHFTYTDMGSVKNHDLRVLVVNVDFLAAHPGYHINPRRINGAVNNFVLDSSSIQLGLMVTALKQLKSTIDDHESKS